MYLERFDWSRLARATAEDPLRVLTSACIVGRTTGWDGAAWPEALVLHLVGLPVVRAASFCPEDVVLGTPRPLTTLRDGDGFAVLDGTARVRDTDGRDCTDALIAGARGMLAVAERERIELCVLLDVSDSCGSNVTYVGHPDERRYERGAGVAAATLVRAGFPVIAQRDHRTLGAIVAALDPTYAVPDDAFDFVDHPWYRETFG